MEGTNGQFTAAAIFFGIGAALVLDEFALILHLQDVYWSRDGRTSVDAVFVAAAVAGLLVLGFNPLSMFEVAGWHHADSMSARIAVILLAVLNLALAVLVLLKGKLWTGLLGMFFTPLLVIGAIRLARPHSPWARWHYLGQARKMHRSWNGSAMSVGRSFRRICGCSMSSRVNRGSPATTRSTRNSTSRSTRPRRPHPKGSSTLGNRKLGSAAVRYFYDTEFIDNGRIIDLISIGVAAEDGREFYAVSAEFDPRSAGRWVRTHVLPKLPSPASPLWRSRRQIREDLEAFLGIDGPEPIELWAWVGAYDHVALCQLWGPMTSLPPQIPVSPGSCVRCGKTLAAPYATSPARHP